MFLATIINTFLTVLLGGMLQGTIESSRAVTVTGNLRNVVNIQMVGGSPETLIQLEGGGFYTPTWQTGTVSGTLEATFKPTGIRWWTVDKTNSCVTMHAAWKVDASNCWFGANNGSVQISGNLRNSVLVTTTNAFGREWLQVIGGASITPTWHIVDSQSGSYTTTVKLSGTNGWAITDMASCTSANSFWAVDPASACWFQVTQKPNVVVSGDLADTAVITMTNAAGNELLQVQGGEFIDPHWQVIDLGAGTFFTEFITGELASWTVDGAGTCSSTNIWWKPDLSNCWFNKQFQPYGLYMPLVQR